MSVRATLRRAVGPLVALAGVAAVVAAIPLRWFGPVPDDSYVFDPPTFSPLWMERTVLPVLTVSVGLLAAVGLLELLRRDRDGMARWHRWSASAAVLGSVLVAVAFALLGPTGPPNGLGDVLVVLGGALFGLVGGVLALVGLVGWGVGYLRAGRTRLGWALLGGSVGVVLVLAARRVVDPGLGGLPAALPLAAMLVVVGRDLHARK